MSIARIRKNDTVIVISGNDAGKTGTVVSVNPKKGTAIVSGVNVLKKAVRRTEKEPGGLIDRELPIRLCKLMPYDAESKKGSRVRSGLKEGASAEAAGDDRAKKRRLKARVLVKSGKAI